MSIGWINVLHRGAEPIKCLCQSFNRQLSTINSLRDDISYFVHCQNSQVRIQKLYFQIQLLFINPWDGQSHPRAITNHQKRVPLSESLSNGIFQQAKSCLIMFSFFSLLYNNNTIDPPPNVILYRSYDVWFAQGYSRLVRRLTLTCNIESRFLVLVLSGMITCNFLFGCSTFQRIPTTFGFTNMHKNELSKPGKC